MKVISFFSEKGGVGKTTLSVLFASWLAYKKHEKVYVMDMDFPSYHLSNIRNTENEFIKRFPQSAFAQMAELSAPYRYPIQHTAGVRAFSQQQLQLIENSLRRQVTSVPERAYYMIDFPGSFLSDDPIFYLQKKGLIDFVIFPLDSDMLSIDSALRTYAEMQKNRGGRQDCLFLWNKEAAKERQGSKDWYGDQENYFRKRGIPFARKRMRDILIARRNSNTFGFIRTTQCWPQNNINKACGYIEEIFEEIKARIDGEYTEEMGDRIYKKEE